MQNWSTDEKRLSKDKEGYAVWKIEQMVNFGLGGKKLKKNELLKYWSKINIDPWRKKFLNLLIHDR